jgi:hypothetical protein
MKTKINLLILLLAALTISCSNSENKQEYSLGIVEYEELPADAYRAVTVEAPYAVVKETVRKLIKKGDVVFETQNIAETKNLITNAVSNLGGYISKDNVYSTESRITHSIEIRVESEKFDELLNLISESAAKIESKTVDVIDVTEEFIDVEARIKTKKEIESRFRELLKMAKSVDEILRIEREIGNVRNEIESAEGRLRYLKDRVAYSTLSVEYFQKLTSNIEFINKIMYGLSQGWDLLLYLFIGLSYIWPFVLIPLIILFTIRFVRKSRKNRK